MQRNAVREGIWRVLLELRESGQVEHVAVCHMMLVKSATQTAIIRAGVLRPEKTNIAKCGVFCIKYPADCYVFTGATVSLTPAARASFRTVS